MISVDISIQTPFILLAIGSVREDEESRLPERTAEESEFLFDRSAHTIFTSAPSASAAT